MREVIVHRSDCTSRYLIRVARKCGFVIAQGGNHCKIFDRSGYFVTAIPRHERLKAGMVREVVKALIAHGARIELR